MELLSKLGIDWRLLIAQIVNFALLVGILAALVYRPLLNVLDKRSERIRKAMEDAKRIEEQSKALEAQRTAKLKSMDQEVGTLLEQARKQAEAVKDEILGEAKREASAMIAASKQQIEEDRAHLLADVQAELARMIVRLTEKIIVREFTEQDQKRLTSAIAKDLPTLLHGNRR